MEGFLEEERAGLGTDQRKEEALLEEVATVLGHLSLEESTGRDGREYSD